MPSRTGTRQPPAALRAQPPGSHQPARRRTVALPASVLPPRGGRDAWLSLPPDQRRWPRLLRDEPPAVVDLSRRFVELVESCGPFHYAVSTTAITSTADDVGLLALTRPAARLDGYLDLQRRGGPADPPRCALHQARVRAPVPHPRPELWPPATRTRRQGRKRGHTGRTGSASRARHRLDR